jgi:FMN-dependent NADH-azoreductase
MKTILQVNTSILGNEGQSTRLAGAFVAELGADTVIVRDLAREPVPHLDAQRFGAFLSRPETRTNEQQVVLDYSDKLIAELKRADTLVLGLPMYNFGVPSMLKAWFDHVARAGVTFRYTEKGPVGLLSGKKAYVFATRGGYYAGTPLDTQTAYVRDFLAFLGITDVEFVYAEGLAIGAASKAEGMAAARTQIERLTPAYA